MGPAAFFMAASTAMSAMSSYQQGKAQQKAAEYNATVAKREARVAEQGAAARESAFRRDVRRRQGQRRAAAGASGIQLEGSPLELLQDAAREEELSALNIRHQGQLQAGSSRSEARMSRFSGRQAYRRGLTQAGSSLLRGGASVYEMESG